MKRWQAHASSRGLIVHNLTFTITHLAPLRLFWEIIMICSGITFGGVFICTFHEMSTSRDLKSADFCHPDECPPPPSKSTTHFLLSAYSPPTPTKEPTHPPSPHMWFLANPREIAEMHKEMVIWVWDTKIIVLIWRSSLSPHGGAKS